MKYLKEFAGQSCFDEEISRNQFLCLWTAYCLHHGLDADTLVHDNELFGLWDTMAEEGLKAAGWRDYESFENFMCRYLV